MYELLERDDLQESKKIESISKELVIAVLSDEQKLALVLSNVNQYLAGEVSFVKSRIDDVEKAADLERLDAVRKSIAKWRVDAGKNYTAIKKANKDLIAKADDGFELVVSAQKNAESEIEQALSAKKQEFEQERLRKKALADAITKLKSHMINPLLPATDIETAIDDFRLSFGDTDYADSQDAAEAIFESKLSEFEVIYQAAVVREENEERVRIGRAKDQQRANINVTFPLAEISGYGNRTAADIQARIDWTDKVDMSAFELVLPEADAQKQACLNMLAAFLPMAVAREQEEIRKAEQEAKEQAEREEFEAKVKAEADAKQALIDAENARLAQIERDRIEAEQAEIARQQAEIKRQQDEIEAREKSEREAKERSLALEVIEVVSEPVADDCVLIPVKHLLVLIYAAEQAAEHCDLDDDDTANAIEFAKSLI